MKIILQVLPEFKRYYHPTMAWIMKKQIKGETYLYLYESRWVAGRPKNVFLKYLGPARRYTKTQVKKIKKEAGKNNKKEKV